MEYLPNLTIFRRYAWNEPNLLVVTGDISPVMKGWEAYNRRYDIADNPPETAAILKRLFWSAGLAAVSLMVRESWGWSMTFSGSTVGLFCGAEPEGMICGRIEPADAQRCSAALQRVKAGEPMKQSTFLPPDDDPVRAVESYFNKVEQIDTRLAIHDEGLGALIQSLPGSRTDTIFALDDERLLRMIYGLAARGELEQTAEMVLFYECRCHEKMISELVANLPKAKQDELWNDSDTIEIQCPRCGREFAISRRDRSNNG